MCETSLSVWFVCRLCRGSFGQVDAFIEHKKQKHFTQFQNTTSIVFEEAEDGIVDLITTNRGDHQLADEINEPPIKIEVNDEDPVIPFSSEINDDLNVGLFEPKSELITYETEINPDDETHFFGLKKPAQNPYVLLKRLTFEEVQSACDPHHHSTLTTHEQKNLASSSEPGYSLSSHSNIHNSHEVKKSTEINPTQIVEHDFLFECKLCSKQLESEAQLKIHVGICALYHKDRNRFCVNCNRKFSYTYGLKVHRLRFHGTVEEKMSLLKFKCHVCPKQFRQAISLTCHLKSHKETKDQVKTSKSKLLACTQPNCGKEFPSNSDLQKHLVAHFGLKPFSCSFLNCEKAFSQRGSLNTHFRTHTGERPFKCTVDNCNEVFITSSRRSKHHRTAHRSL